ncbi:hypothetical protein [Micromonospora sp. NPDC049374]|uniref:hypothetical protein n=1 Tax=Micromonospora sp. NPDC049374 TaxID=3154352 RepID=UPI00342D80D4
MIGTVDVYHRNDGDLYIVSYSRSLNGPFVLNGWCRTLPADSPDESLGEAVLEGLAVGGRQVLEESSDELKKHLKPLLRLAGVKSFTAFAAGALSVGIETDVTGSITFSPTENRGRRGGFMFRSEGSIKSPAKVESAEVGRLVREVMKSSSTL